MLAGCSSPATPTTSAAELEGLAGIRWRLDVWNASAQVSNDVL